MITLTAIYFTALIVSATVATLLALLGVLFGLTLARHVEPEVYVVGAVALALWACAYWFRPVAAAWIGCAS